MKKYALLLLILTLVVGCLMAFSSCGDKPAPTPDDPTPGDTTCEHAWNAGEVTTPATCTAAGVKTFTCTKCNETKTEAIDALDHAWNTDFTVDTPATCAAKGSKSIHCANCNEKKDVTEIDTVDHNYVYTVTKEPTLFANGSRHGVCSVCGGDVEDNAYSSVEEHIYSTEETGRTMIKKNIYNDVMNGGEKHFYNGNDLFVEYSLLWNDSFKNLSAEGGHPIIGCRIGNEKDSDTSDFTWMSLKDNASGSDCVYAGGFEYGSLTTVEVGPAGMNKVSPNYSDYPNIGGADQANPEYGWHRIGIKVHQEVTNEDALKADTTAGATKATYYMYVEVYLDGALLYKLSGTSATKLPPVTNLLFTAESDGNGGIVYNDIGEEKYIFILRMPGYFTLDGFAYLVYADYSATCGTDFVQQVTRVDTPAANTYTAADGAVIDAPIYYSLP
ncbi:MAG: hypothetical protein MJ082_04730 [Clostridia bacterium]|nr:hypothetical protein [Clostridia bacterium]